MKMAEILCITSALEANRCLDGAQKSSPSNVMPVAVLIVRVVLVLPTYKKIGQRIYSGIMHKS